MRLTTKGRFAVTAMLDLALHSTKGPVTLAGISARQRISLSYLEQLFGKLRRRALVESVRGREAATTWRGMLPWSPWRTSSMPSRNRSIPRSAAARRIATTTTAA